MSLLNMLQESLGRIVDCQRGALLRDVIIGPQIVPVVLLVIVDQFPGKHGLHLRLKLSFCDKNVPLLNHIASYRAAGTALVPGQGHGHKHFWYFITFLLAEEIIITLLSIGKY